MMFEQSKINWYPGHMAKAQRLLLDQLRQVDLILEVCDARLPVSSRNPELVAMIRNKRHLLLMNKCDLAEAAATAQRVKLFRDQGVNVLSLEAHRLKKKELISKIDFLTRDLVEKNLAKGIRKTVKALVIGVPNVGKSTVINHLRGNNIAKTGDLPGVTRAQQSVRITPYLELLDTPGILPPRLDDQLAAQKLCWIGIISDQVVDIYSLTCSLLEELKKKNPDQLQSRYHLQGLEGSGLELIEAICRGRGWILKGSEPDYDRCCRMVLDEFRAGLIGRITLE